MRVLSVLPKNTNLCCAVLKTMSVLVCNIPATCKIARSTLVNTVTYFSNYNGRQKKLLKTLSENDTFDF